MKTMFAVISACLILTFTASSTDGGKEVRDWLSSGYVVSGYNVPAATKWSPAVPYYAYYDYSSSDPWYRYVARPYLDSWYWPPSYYRGYPVSYYYRPTYYWYSSPWRYSIYF
jgi:hypothetical protein